MTINFAMLTTFLCLACLLISSQAAPAQLPKMISQSKRTPKGIHLPVKRQSRTRMTGISRRGDVTTSADLGDTEDLMYTVQMKIGNTLMPFALDTGSSDIWVASEDCQEQVCQSGVPLYSTSTFKSSGLPLNLTFGDSTSRTFASGVIGTDTIILAGVEIKGQLFISANSTNNSLPLLGASGNFGLSFPTERQVLVTLCIYYHVFISNFPKPSSLLFEAIEHPFQQPPITSLDQVPDTFVMEGPLMSRLSQSALVSPEFTLTLQREKFDIGDNNGLLSMGELPPGVSNDSFTWVPVRRYTHAEGGLAAGNETFPVQWEVPIDDVFIDGQRLPQSNLTPNISLTGLVDSGSAAIRGPSDVVANLNTILSGSPNTNIIDCGTPHTLAFQIGGKMFPIDPRDFYRQTVPDNLDNCTTNVVSTDPPKLGFLQSWVLGDQLFKSTIVSFYFGNLTHPSVDPPRIGFLSTVPPNADQLYLKALANAKQNGNNFPASIVDAPAPTVSVFTTFLPPSPEPTNSVVSSDSSRPVPLFTSEQDISSGFV
ncbi:hypothetical protein Clacol_005109 [Clathrus columnatus]|uniref:Peptidase A1 domain-containing protein n=1 Tax=Clathrus columnatus TaxID=1419009 RepID=A0AAV5AEF2_9AGAM|nr:hypothetical protein Clacol_005109 [Clathrus columnatus]